MARQSFFQKASSAFLAAFDRRNVRPLVEMGVGGAEHSGGYLLTNEKHASLVGRSRYKTFSDILVNTSIAAASVRYFLNLVAKASWKVEANPDVEGSDEIAARINEALFDMEGQPWHRVVRRMAMYRFYGFSLQEWTMARHEEGWFTYASIDPRPQVTIERWDIDPTGRVVGVGQRDPNSGREHYLPRAKLVYAVDDAIADTPEGAGLLRAVAEPARRLKRFEQLEGYAFETDLRGVPIARAPLAAMRKMVKDGNMTEAQYNLALETPKDFIQNHVRNPSLGMVLDSDVYRSADESATPSGQKKWDIDLLKASSSHQTEVAATIYRLNQEIARVLGTEGLLLGADGKGSYALGKDKTSNFHLTVDGTLGEACEVVKRDVVGPVCDINGWDRSAVVVSVQNIHTKDVEMIVKALSDMATAGAILLPDDPVINDIRDLLGVPRQDDDAVMQAEQDRIDREDAAAAAKLKPKPAAGE